MLLHMYLCPENDLNRKMVQDGAAPFTLKDTGLHNKGAELFLEDSDDGIKSSSGIAQPIMEPIRNAANL